MIKFDKDKALEMAKNISDKFSAEETKEFISKFSDLSFIEDLKLLFKIITDKEYKVDTKTYMIIAGAIAYVVLPTDVLPDFIPGVGFIDDAFVIGVTIKQLKDEIEKYKKFKNETQE